MAFEYEGKNDFFKMKVFDWHGKKIITIYIKKQIKYSLYTELKKKVLITQISWINKKK